MHIYADFITALIHFFISFVYIHRLIFCKTPEAAVGALWFFITTGDLFDVTNDFEYMQKVTQYPKEVLSNSFSGHIDV